jgi:hypothetical protein
MSTAMLRTWKCPKCGKEMVSLYEKQLEEWIHMHQLHHKKRYHPSKTARKAAEGARKLRGKPKALDERVIAAL